MTHKRWMCPIAIVFLLLIQGTIQVSASYNRDVEAQFQEGVQRYRDGHFHRARLNFQYVVKAPPNQRSSAAQLMLAKTFYKLGEYERAIQSARELLKRYPTSRYVAYAYYLIGHCYVRQKEYVRAARFYARAEKQATEPELRAKAAGLLSALAEAKLEPSEVRALQRLAKRPADQDAKAWRRIQTLFEEGRKEEGRVQAELFLRQYPHSPYMEDVERLISQQKQVYGGAPRVAVLCPLSGPDQRFGEELLRGVELGYEELPLSVRQKLDLIVEDSKSQPIEAIRGVQQLGQEVIALIGPVFGSSAIGVAAAANCKGIPMIAPVATENGLSSIGSYVFQLNVTPAVQGRRMAEYAVEELGLHTFAVIGSLDAYGEQMSEAFVSMAEQLGGQVVGREWFAPGATDFRAPIERIRQEGLALFWEKRRRALEDSLRSALALAGPEDPIWAALDSTIAHADQPDSAWAEANLPGTDVDALIATLVKHRLDRERSSRSVRSIEGFFIAASADEVVQIVSHLAFLNIRSQLLGGNGWSDEKITRIGELDGAVFCANYLPEAQIAQTRRFVDTFQSKFRMRPGMAAAFGYDAMQLIGEAFGRGARDRMHLRDALASVRNVVGASGPISFSEGDRANEAVSIFRIDQGEIVFIGYRFGGL